MNIKQNFKDRFARAYLYPEDRQWIRAINALIPVFCFICAAIAIYLLNTQPHPDIQLSYIFSLVAWGYIATSLPLAFLLYKKSELKKYERFILTMFILISSMSFMLSILLLPIKT